MMSTVLVLMKVWAIIRSLDVEQSRRIGRKVVQIVKLGIIEEGKSPRMFLREVNKGVSSSRICLNQSRNMKRSYYPNLNKADYRQII